MMGDRRCRICDRPDGVEKPRLSSAASVVCLKNDAYHEHHALEWRRLALRVVAERDRLSEALADISGQLAAATAETADLNRRLDMATRPQGWGQ